MNRGDPDHRRAYLVLEAPSDMQGILHSHSKEPILPLDVARRFKALVNTFREGYSLLANAADREGICLFSIAPKHHWLWHLGDRALLLNPRKACCLLDEDYVDKIKLVVAANSHGNPTHEIQNKVAEQYHYGFWFAICFGA